MTRQISERSAQVGKHLKDVNYATRSSDLNRTLHAPIYYGVRRIMEIQIVPSTFIVRRSVFLWQYLHGVYLVGLCVCITVNNVDAHT